jgi:preprotein translocase subunit SecB
MNDINSQIDKKFNDETLFAVVINAILENKYNNTELASNKESIIKNANAYCKIKKWNCTLLYDKTSDDNNTLTESTIKANLFPYIRNYISSIISPPISPSSSPPTTPKGGKRRKSHKKRKGTKRRRTKRRRH